MAPLSVEQALRAILADAVPLAGARTGIHEAAGRVLAEPVLARMTQPPFDASAMDGYAVRAADVSVLPATLRVIGEAAAGRGFGGKLGAGDAVRIFTGAPIPAGADAIVIQENVTRDGDRVAVVDGVPDADHIRPRGGDFAEGHLLLKAGRKLDARALTLAAAGGHADLVVHRKPVVAILATGDELVPPGTMPGPDQIVSSNPVGLAAMVRGAGADVRLLGIARDTPADLKEKIAAAEGADVLVTIGGASVGDHDLVAPALRSAGVALAFWKIAMRPGKPMMFGQRGALKVLGLPGNPVSSLICARVFLLPLLARLAGHPDNALSGSSARLTAPIGKNGPRQHYMRASLDASDPTDPRVRPAISQDSSLLSPLADANCLIVRASGAPALDAGARVSILTLDF